MTVIFTFSPSTGYRLPGNGRQRSAVSRQWRPNAGTRPRTARAPFDGCPRIEYSIRTLAPTVSRYRSAWPGAGRRPQPIAVVRPPGGGEHRLGIVEEFDLLFQTLSPILFTLLPLGLFAVRFDYQPEMLARLDGTLPPDLALVYDWHDRPGYRIRIFEIRD